MAFLMPRARTAGAAAAVLALVGCELTRSPTAITLTEDRVMLQSVLLAGDSTARALIRLIPATSDPFNPFAQPEWIPIEGATVRLVSGADTTAMTPRPDAPVNSCMPGSLDPHSPAGALLPGCYIGSVPGGIVSGEAYELIIDLPARGRLHGSTIVPAVPVITAPEAGTRLATATTLPGTSPTFLVAWLGSPAARRAELAAESQDEQCTAHVPGTMWFDFGWIPVTGLTSAEVSVQLQCSVTRQTDVPGEMVLTTFDSVYTHYTRVTLDPHRMADATAGFTGPAIGIFASGAAARQPVTFVPN